ncbi:MAG: [LysW]-lysine hydrolase [Planctomycetota bacterium]
MSRPVLSNPDELVVFDLVATPSVSGSEAAAVGVFVRHASALGLATEIDEAGNAIAHAGPADAPGHIVLLGHIDTVPGDLPVTLQDGVLHGRGSVDAKGPLAAMLIAASRARMPNGVRVSVAAAVGEETADSPGARHLAGQYRPDACIIGEPSGWDGVTLGYKGCLTISARCERESSHSAGPDGSACDALMAWWADAGHQLDAFNESHTRMFEQIQATVRQIQGGDDGVTQHADLIAGFRLPPGITPDRLAADLRDSAPSHIRLSHTGGEIAAHTDRRDPVVRSLSASIRDAGARPRHKLKTGTADFNVVAPVWNCPIAAYGPGDSSLDHTPSEHLIMSDFHRSIAVLSNTVELLAGEIAADQALPSVPSSTDPVRQMPIRRS